MGMNDEYDTQLEFFRADVTSACTKALKISDFLFLQTKDKKLQSRIQIVRTKSHVLSLLSVPPNL